MAPTARKPSAFITGVAGQDGFYLARLLLGRGYRVVGAVHRAESEQARSAAAELPGAEIVPFDLLDLASVAAAIERAAPDEIYHLAGKSSVAETWSQPQATMRVNIEGTLNLLEEARRQTPAAHFVLAGSGDCFDHEAAGPRGLHPAAPIRCTNLYAISKAAAMQCVQRYREQHGMRASVAIMMNHASPRRPNRFVEMKIVHESVAIMRGRAEPIELGSLETRRDWSWAEDIVEGLAALGARPAPGDYVFASGELRTTGDWVRLAFARLGLDPARHVKVDASRLHPGDRPHTFGDISPAARDLGWRPQTSFEQMAERLIESELAAAS